MLLLIESIRDRKQAAKETLDRLQRLANANEDYLSKF